MTTDDVRRHDIHNWHLSLPPGEAKEVLSALADELGFVLVPREQWTRLREAAANLIHREK